MKLGIFGGTFDPPHWGHLILAEAAREQLQLDQVLWLVAGQSPLKQTQPISPATVRAEMVQAAIADNPNFALSRIDLDRPPPHYTVDSLKLLRHEFPAAEFYFLMGEDSLRDIPRWRNPEELISLTRLVVAERPGVEADLRDVETRAPGISKRVQRIDAPLIALAASDIRRRIREGRTVRYRLPPEVYRIIEREQLYVV